LRYNFDIGRFFMAFWVTILLYNVTEGIFNRLSVVWFLFLLVATKCPVLSQHQLSGIIRDDNDAKE
jgi:hypothetical protein